MTSNEFRGGELRAYLKVLAEIDRHAARTTDGMAAVALSVLACDVARMANARECA